MVRQRTSVGSVGCRVGDGVRGVRGNGAVDVGGAVGRYGAADRPWDRGAPARRRHRAGRRAQRYRILQVSYVATGTIPTRQSLSVNAAVAGAPRLHPGPERQFGWCSVPPRWVATIDTTTGLVSYADTHGNPLTSNCRDLRASPATAPGAQQQVDTTFSSPAGEGLFGLGQQQDGVMNYKGHQVTLDQFNVGAVGGQIGMPS